MTEFHNDALAILRRVLDEPTAGDAFETELRTMLALAFDAAEIERLEDACDRLASACFVEKRTARRREARHAAVSAMTDDEVQAANPSGTLQGALGIASAIHLDGALRRIHGDDAA